MWTREYALMIVLTLTACFAPVSSATARVLYVDDDANGANNGSSWQDAYRFLQDALARAENGDEIRVAQGTYKPDQSSKNRTRFGSGGDRIATFELKNGVTLKGGYAGLSEPDPNVRDISRHETVLSGDLSGNDAEVTDAVSLLDDPHRSDNSYHVVRNENLQEATTLDGFTVIGGNANDAPSSALRHIGGGLYNTGVVTMANCTFRANAAVFSGGGICSEGSGTRSRDASLTLTNCEFSRNCSNVGGAISSVHSRLVAAESTFFANSAADLSGWGGAIYNENSDTSITKCIFRGNRTGAEGGGIANTKYGELAVTDCVFAGNASKRGRGGAISNLDMGSLTLVNCTLSGNAAGHMGGGVFNNSDATMTNSILWGNTCGSDITTLSQIGSPAKQPAVDYCCVQGLTGTPGSAACHGRGNIDVNPRLTADGHLCADSPCIDAGGTSNRRNLRTTDSDGDWRSGDEPIDIGADEFVDGDGDRLPDWWEHTYFGDPNVANASEDPDDDGLANLDEYESYSSDPTAAPLYVEPSAASVRLLHEGTHGGRDGDIALPPPAIAMNLAGYPRPMGTAVDMGNYERQDRPPPALPGPRIIYVDTRANGADDGSSWQDAYRFLQDALADANDSEKPAEIYVAQGTYTPDRGDGYLRGDKQAKFLLNSGTTLRGGFAGIEADDPNAWDCRTYKTVLSGDLDSNDARRLENFTENSDHVIWCIEADATAVLDGFTITGGYATDRVGGGLLNYCACPTVRRCIFFDNYASQGGGMANRHSSPTVIACTFTGNYAPLGGGGMYNTDQSHPVVRSCVFHDNRTRYLGGGGMYSGDSNPTVTSCFFVRNGAPFGGGMYNVAAEPVISNCTFTSNHVPSWGGGMQNEGGARPIVTNCILWGNSPDQIRTFTGFSGAVVVTYSDVQGGHPGQGNTNVDPLLTPDGHLRAGSPCINAGDPSATSDPGVRRDMDDESRVLAARVDMGADEFIDSDGDGLPDWWEQTYFGGVRAADPGDDPDGDGLANLGEYALYSSAPTAAPIRVDPLRGPFPTLQAAINVAQDGDTVLVAPGTYRGSSNRDLDFRGKSVVLRAVEGPEATVIDCQGRGRGFHFHWGETAGAAVIGFTVTNGRAEQGAAIRCEASNPQFRNCVITNNSDLNDQGAALYARLTLLTLADCEVTKNYPRGVSIDSGGAQILGTVNIASNDCTGRNLMLYGQGALRMQPDVTLDLQNCRIRCDISGPGQIRVPLGSDLLVESDALLDLGHETEPHGLIVCDGLLRVKDEAVIANAQVNVTRASFEDNAIIANCVFEAEAGAPYGQFFIEDNVQLWLDSITADGDRYLDLDPRVFDCNSIHIDTIDVHVTEGIGGTHGGLFELRGTDLALPLCGPDEFLCPVEKVPDFGPDTWTLDRLELVEGAKLNLTNRFDFQAPYDMGGESEVLYVRELILGPNSVLNTAFNHLYYETLVMAPTAEVVHVPLLGFSLNNITFDDENDFQTRVTHNNHLDMDEQPPDTTRIHVERIVGHELDPNGVMRMCNLRDVDPDSPTRGQTIHARAKGLFAKSSENEILIRFEYLFSDPASEGELVIYLSDTPAMLDHNDSLRELHYLEVARLPHPPAGRPGSAASDTWGVFEKVVSHGELDFVRGTRIEFELIGPEGTCLLINNWDPAIRCTMTCGDVAGAYHQVDAVDFLAVMSECGRRIRDVPTPGASGAWCLDGFFCADGYVTPEDAMAIDWIGRKSLCPNKLIAADLGPFASASAVEALPGAGTAGVSATPAATRLDSLRGEFLVAGKRYEPYEQDIDDFSSDRLYDMGRYVSDRLYDIDRYGNLVNDPFHLEQDRLNGKLVRDQEGTLYQLNLEYGLVRIADDTVVLGPAALHVESEPRYGELATIYVGFQEQSEDSWGRPLLDAAFDAQGHVYVVPVVVAPVAGSPYLAAAKLAIGQDPSTCTVLQLFDHVPTPNDNQTVDQLREIEVDPAGNVYVLNCHCDNNSDILWAYSSDGQILARRELGKLGVHAPVGVCVSAYDSSRLYLSSSRNRPDSMGVKIYVLSTDGLVLSEVIEVQNLGHVTGIAENPLDGTLCVVGFAMPTIPTQSEIQDAETILNMNPFYEPRIAIISYRSTGTVKAVDPCDISAHCDLALPLSVTWTGLTEDRVDLAKLAADWLELAVTSSLW